MKAVYSLPGLAAEVADLPLGVSSQVYFCLTCGRRWADILVGGSTSWGIQPVPCVDHAPGGVTDWGLVPGSLICRLVSTNFVGKGGWASCVEYIPPALWARELEVHLKHFYKELE